MKTTECSVTSHSIFISSLKSPICSDDFEAKVQIHTLCSSDEESLIWDSSSANIKISLGEDANSLSIVYLLNKKNITSRAVSILDIHSQKPNIQITKQNKKWRIREIIDNHTVRYFKIETSAVDALLVDIGDRKMYFTKEFDYFFCNQYEKSKVKKRCSIM